MKYFGHLVTADGNEDKIPAVKDFPRPQNFHEIHSFLGLWTYYRHFVPNFAIVAASMYEFTKKSKVYQWGESQEKAFQTLKNLLCASIAYPVKGEKF